MSYSPEYGDQRGGLLATGSRDKVVKLINAGEDYVICAEFWEHESAIIHVEFRDIGGQLFLTSFDCTGTIIMRHISDQLQFGQPMIKSYQKCVFSAFQQDGLTCLGLENKIQVSELKSPENWTSPKTAFNNNVPKDFIWLEMDETGSFIVASSRR